MGVGGIDDCMGTVGNHRKRNYCKTAVLTGGYIAGVGEVLTLSDERFTSLTDMYANSGGSFHKDGHACTSCGDDDCPCGNWCGQPDSCCCEGCKNCNDHSSDNDDDDDNIPDPANDSIVAELDTESDDDSDGENTQ